nr:integrase, catalytic region, zinc finger, CCHC-type, peptidase aspartic, catalytic [Tanacetum cinerariifolium]
IVRHIVRHMNKRNIAKNKCLQIQKKNILIHDESLITDCIAKDVCSIMLASEREVLPRSNCQCEELQSNYDREHSRVLEFEAEIAKKQQMLAKSENQNSLIHTLYEKTYYELLKGKKTALKYFRVFGSLCYPTNDYDDVGRTRSALVNDPPTSSVPLTMQQFQELFQPMMVDEDEEFPPAAQIYPVHVNAAQAPENANGSPSTTNISKGAPAVNPSSSASKLPSSDTDVPGSET